MSIKELDWILDALRKEEMTIFQLDRLFSEKFGLMDRNRVRDFRHAIETMVRLKVIERAAPPGDWPNLYRAAKAKGTGEGQETR